MINATAADLSAWVSIASDNIGFDASSVGKEEVLQRFVRSIEFAAIDSVWTNHAKGLSAPSVDCELVAGLQIHLLRLYLLVSCQFFGFVNPWKPTEEYRALDMDWGWVAKELDRFLSVDSAHWLAIPGETRFTSDVALETVADCERFCAFQDQVFREKDLRIFDPRSGCVKSCRDSYHLFGRGVYLFSGKNPFYLITAGAGHKATCLYLPELQIVIDFRAGVSQILNVDVLATTFAAQIRRLATHNPEFVRALSRSEDEISSKKIILLAGQIENFAHHLWNFYPGIERIVENGCVGNVAAVWTFGTEFFGPFVKIFPEFEGVHVHKTRASLIGGIPFESDYLFFQAGGYFIRDSLRKRVAANVAEVTSSEIPDGAPLIWFGLRVGSRSWLDQDSHIPALIERIMQIEPHAHFVLDGFSFPVGADHISAKWATAIGKIAEMAEDIVSNSKYGGRITNLVGGKLDTALAYAMRTSLYIAPIGTTQHKVGWFADGEGIIYCEPSILKTRAERRPGCWESESRKLPRYIIGRSAGDGERRSVNDRRPNLENIELDLEELFLMVMDGLKKWRDGIHEKKHRPSA